VLALVCVGPTCCTPYGRDGHWRFRIALGRRQFPRPRGGLLIHLPGLSTPRVLQAVLVGDFRLDSSSRSLRGHAGRGDPGAEPPVVAEMNAAAGQARAKRPLEPRALMAFYAGG
jgi:hypothetical protein